MSVVFINSVYFIYTSVYLPVSLLLTFSNNKYCILFQHFLFVRFSSICWQHAHFMLITWFGTIIDMPLPDYQCFNIRNPETIYENNFILNAMKYISFLIIGLSLIAGFTISSGNAVTAAPVNIPVNRPDDTLKIMSSPELYNLTKIWASEYARVNPDRIIRITNGNEDPSFANNSLSFISNGASNFANNVANWKMVIGHDAIVPVINAKNPMLDAIYKQGISPQGFEQFFGDPEKLNWANFINGGQNIPVHVYIIENESVKTGLANFTQTDHSSISGISISTSGEFVSAVEKDMFAIGFCKLSDVCNPNSNELPENIKFLPIDKNGNGRIDNFENIYGNPSAFLRGVWIGKYPKTLCGSIYAIAPEKPTDKNTVAFLTWVMGDGGKFLNNEWLQQSCRH